MGGGNAPSSPAMGFNPESPLPQKFLCTPALQRKFTCKIAMPFLRQSRPFLRPFLMAAGLTPAPPGPFCSCLQVIVGIPIYSLGMFSGKEECSRRNETEYRSFPGIIARESNLWTIPKRKSSSRVS